jgi:predicted extracellular nuclease
VRENERPLGPPDVGPSLLKVAGFNVLNYFTTLDGNGSICGPNADQSCRGADSAFEFDRQKAKLVSAITTLDADIVGLTELENAADNVPIADLVDGLNGVAGAGTYAYIATGAIGTDAIRQGIIYKPSNVMPVGGFAILDSSVDPLFNDDLNRPVLAQTFDDNTFGERVTIAVNHLKSKGSDCNDVGDPDTGDGQGNCNGTRTNGAQALVDWLATDPTGSGDSDFLIVGDLNAYAMEDPVMVIEVGGYIDLIKTFVGTGFADGAYSFNLFSQAGYLDHALSSPDLLLAVSGAAPWHINADEPSGLDYNSFNQPDLFNSDEFRSSDHDAIVVGLLVDTDEDGVWDGVDMCSATVIPESVPTDELKFNRFALVDGDGIFDTSSNGKGPDVSFDIFDTVGCSCEQIIEAQGLGKGQRKYGCSRSVMEAWVEYANLP